MEIGSRNWRTGARRACAAIGLAALVLNSPAMAADALKLENGVVPHEKIDQLYHRLAKAVSALDSSGMSSIYADNVFYLAPDAPLATGIDGMKPHWDGWFSWMKDAKGSLKMNFRVVAREVHGDAIGYDIGYYKTLQKRPNEADAVFEGKLIVVTKKQPDGEWRFQADAYNSLKKAE